MTQKHGIMIRDQSRSDAIKTNNVSKENFGNLWCCKLGAERGEMCMFGELIDPN